MFNVVKAWELDSERDVFLGLPVEGSNTKQAFHRVPVRSSNLSDGRRTQMVQGNVVSSTQGLKRLLLEFPKAYCPGVKAALE